MGQDPTITLSIKEAGERPNSTYLFHIQLDGNVITSNQSLSLPDSQAVREISRSFGSLFEQGCRPEMDADAQRALGKQLFDLWLAPSWEKITAAVPVGALRFLVIASEIPEILNLPWELLLPPEGDFLGINPLFRIRRFPSTAKQMATFAGELRPRPLRLLFMACSPTNLATLDYEKEEEALFRAIYGQDVAFDSCDQGTFEELKEKVNEFKPHIVHLTGHGAVLNGKGHFAFEKEDGTADLVPSEELRRFLSGSGVQCVFVSGCQSGKAPAGGFERHLPEPGGRPRCPWPWAGLRPSPTTWPPALTDRNFVQRIPQSLLRLEILCERNTFSSFLPSKVYESLFPLHSGHRCPHH